MPIPPDDLSPGQVALTTVEHNRDDHHRAMYDLVLEPPLPEPPKTGWLHLEEERGWGPNRATVYWLREDGAEAWTFDPTPGKTVTTCVIAPVSSQTLARWIAIFQSLDRVRTVPKRAGIPHLEHDRHGGDDHDGYAVTAVSLEPEAAIVRFGPAFPSLWNAIRGPMTGMSPR